MTRTVGGTLVSRILGVSKWGGPLSAYYELREGVEASSNDSMGRGKALEPTVLSLHAYHVAGVLLDPPPGRIEGGPSMPYAHATLDALVAARHAVEPIITEAKTLSFEMMGPEWGEPESDKVQAEYHLQTLWYLGVARAAGLTVAPFVDLPVLCGPEAELEWAARLALGLGRSLGVGDIAGSRLELRLYRIPWDDKLFAWVHGRVRRFLREHVECGKPPQPGEGDILMERDLEAVKRGAPKPEAGKVVDFEKLAGPEQIAFLSLLEANRQRKEWVKVEEQAAARVQLLMGPVEEVRGMPGGARVTWKGIKSGARRFEVKEPKA